MNQDEYIKRLGQELTDKLAAGTVKCDGPCEHCNNDYYGGTIEAAAPGQTYDVDTDAVYPNKIS